MPEIQIYTIIRKRNMEICTQISIFLESPDLIYLPEQSHNIVILRKYDQSKQ